MATKIKIRRETLNNWTTYNPILELAEQAYVTDTGKMKIGTGVDTFSQLDYFDPTFDGNFHEKSFLEGEQSVENELLIYNVLTDDYEKITKHTFLDGENVKMYTTRAGLLASDIHGENDLVYLVDNNSIYKYVTGLSTTTNTTSILPTYDGGNTRWLAICGTYVYGDTSVTGNVKVNSGAFYVDGNKVIGARSATVNTSELTSPTSGSGADATTFDGSECTALRTDISNLKSTIDSLLTKLKTHGIIAS